MDRKTDTTDVTNLLSLLRTFHSQHSRIVITTFTNHSYHGYIESVPDDCDCKEGRCMVEFSWEVYPDERIWIRLSRIESVAGEAITE